MTGGWPASTTQCPPGCGLCCERITLGPATIERIFGPAYDARAADPAWNQPTAGHGADGENGIPNPRGLSWLHDASFIREHFHFHSVIAGHELSPRYHRDDNQPVIQFTCDAFDTATRSCTAYDERPLMCENYPFYGRPPSTADDGINDLACVYQDDVPGRRVLPLEVLRG